MIHVFIASLALDPCILIILPLSGDYFVASHCSVMQGIITGNRNESPGVAFPTSPPTNWRPCSSSFKVWCFVNNGITSHTVLIYRVCFDISTASYAIDYLRVFYPGKS